MVNGKTVRAHRFAYETFVGPIPDGLYVCHRCNNKFCVNPDHLYAGTAQQNQDDMMRAGRHFSQQNPRAMAALRERVKLLQAKRAAQPNCKRGHPLSGGNLIITTVGWRGCQACRRIRAAERRAEKRAILGGAQ